MSKHEPEKEMTAELLLADAEREDRPLHEMFDWGDKTEAGRLRRLMQVEDLFANLMVVLDDGSQVPAYVRSEKADGWITNPAAQGTDS